MAVVVVVDDNTRCAQKTPRSHKAKHAPAKKLVGDPVGKKPMSGLKMHPKACKNGPEID